MGNPMDDFILDLVSKSKEKSESKADTSAQAVSPEDIALQTSLPADQIPITTPPVVAEDPKPAVTADPVAQENTPPAQPEVTGPVKPVADLAPEIKEGLDKEIDALLNEIDQLGKQPKQEDVKKEEEQKTKMQGEIEDKLDRAELSVDEKQEIINYVDELETQVAQHELQKRTYEVQVRQLEQMLERERTRTNELFEKTKDLEWEQKKIKSTAVPTELSTLVDHYKLMTDNPSLFNKRNFIGALAKLGEQTTELNLDNYILDRLKSGSTFNREEAGSEPVSPQIKGSTGRDDLIKAVAF